MKTKILFICLMTLGMNYAWSVERICYADYEITEFNFIDEVDINGNVENYYLEKENREVYLFPMKNSPDALIVYLDDSTNKLIPVAFVTINDTEVIYKDINTRESVLAMNLDADKNISALNYYEENDSKKGLALSSGCMGGSTIGCVNHAVQSCWSDAWCTIGCAAVLNQCISAIAVACAIHCNT